MADGQAVGRGERSRARKVSSSRTSSSRRCTETSSQQPNTTGPGYYFMPDQHSGDAPADRPPAEDRE